MVFHIAAAVAAILVNLYFGFMYYKLVVFIYFMRTSRHIYRNLALEMKPYILGALPVSYQLNHLWDTFYS